MKGILCLATLVVLFVGTQGFPPITKICRTSASCDPGECCSSTFWFYGFCSSPTAAGEKCLANQVKFPLTDMYIISCPCDTGLSCLLNVGDKNDGTCQPPSTTETPGDETSQPDTSDTNSDGSSDENTSSQQETTQGGGTSSDESGDSGETNSNEDNGSQTEPSDDGGSNAANDSGEQTE